jgi:hypothetical protein
MPIVPCNGEFTFGFVGGYAGCFFRHFCFSVGATFMVARMLKLF